MKLTRYNVNGLCEITCDVDSPLGRSVDLHINHFTVSNNTNADKPDIAFHSELPAPSKDAVSTADGLFYDGDLVYMEDGLTAISYKEGRLDVYSLKGLAPHPFIQIIGATKGFYLCHSAAINYNGAGIVLPAWGGVGKTALVSNVVHDEGAQILGDDFCILHKNKNLYSYPLPFSVYFYHKPLFPHLFENSKNRSAIAGKYLLPLIKAFRPYVMLALQKHPNLEEKVKKFGRGYSVVQIRDIFPANKIGESAELNKLVMLERYKGETFQVESIDPEIAVRSILGIAHYEFACGPGMHYLLTLASFGLLNIADYFSSHENTVRGLLDGVECLSLKIPENAPARTIGDYFREEILKNIDKAETVSISHVRS